MKSEGDGAIGLEENYQKASDMIDIARSLRIFNPESYENFETLLENTGFESMVIYKLCQTAIVESISATGLSFPPKISKFSIQTGHSFLHVTHL